MPVKIGYNITGYMYAHFKLLSGVFMDNLEPSQNQSSNFEIEYNDRTYRFVPQSNYWICIKSPLWTEQWVICSDEMGIKLIKYCESEGYDMEQLLIDNKCSKKRMRIFYSKDQKKKEGKVDTGFVSLFEEPEDDSDEDTEDDDGFISLF